MSFESFQAFLAMGGHALYVWLSYGLGAFVVAYNVLAPIRRRRRLLAEQRGRDRRRERDAGVAAATSDAGP